MAEVTQMPPSETPPVSNIPPEFEEKPTTPAPRKAGRPTRGNEKPIEAKTMEFFARVAAVPQIEWGTRAFMYVYADEPICKAKSFGEKRFLLKSSKPILDLQQLKEDYGSFAGWMTLNLRKTGKDATDEVDRFNFEIYDPKYPPKIPRIAWVNDDRNKRWEALLPPEPPAANAAAASLTDAIKVYKEIRDEVRDEREEPETPFDQTRSTLETMKLAKELFAPPTQDTAVPADPFDTAKKIMDMRGNDPMIAALMQRLDAADKAAEKAREREFELMKELRQTAAPAAEKPKTLMEQLTDFKALKDLFTNGSVNETVRTSRTTALDVARDLGSKFFESDLAIGVGQYLASLATRNVSGNPAQMNPPQNGVQRPANDFEAFIQNVLNPALLRHYIQGFTGGEFAGWLYDGYPDRVVQLQNFTHPMMPGLKGANAIIQAYKRTESMWPTLSSARPNGEAGFTEFVMEFCAWKPESDEPIEVKPVEHDGEQEEEGPERI